MTHQPIDIRCDAIDRHATANGPPLGTSEFASIAAIMQSDARIHLSDSKRTLVHSRLCRRLRQHGVGSFADYLRLVQANQAERSAMVVALTTNHTHFFRENHHFDHLRDHAVPWLQRRRGPIRIWSAGCSSGEEVYSVAMTLLGPNQAAAAWMRSRDVRLLATDLSPLVVESTRQATYPATVVEPVPAAYRAAWMRAGGETYAMGPEARALVTARVLNLFGAWPMRQTYDIIFCRNVMIYFDDAAKAELEARLVELLAPGGYLYIGHSERLIGAAAQRMRSCGQTIYVRDGDES